MRIYFFTAPLAYSDFPGGSKSRLYKISLSLCHKKASRHKNHHFQHVIRLILEGNQKNVKREIKKGQGSGLALGACCPLIVSERGERVL